MTSVTGGSVSGAWVKDAVTVKIFIKPGVFKVERNRQRPAGFRNRDCCRKGLIDYKNVLISSLHESILIPEIIVAV